MGDAQAFLRKNTITSATIAMTRPTMPRMPNIKDVDSTLAILSFAASRSVCN